jgi:hypothetical protein
MFLADALRAGTTGVARDRRVQERLWQPAAHRVEITS